MSKSRKKKRFRPMRLEQLERREVRAGDVDAEMTGTSHIDENAPSKLIESHATLVDGTLSILGGNDADRISLSREFDQAVVSLTADGVVDQEKRFPLSKLLNVEIDARKGDDIIEIADTVFANMLTVDAGEGDDAVISVVAEHGFNVVNAEAVAAGNFGVVHQKMREQGVDLGEPIGKPIHHRSKSFEMIASFENGDIALDGNTGSVYVATDRSEWSVDLTTWTPSLFKLGEEDYFRTDFFNHQSTYTQRPTLLVITKGLDGGGEDGYSWNDENKPEDQGLLPESAARWTTELASSYARQLNLAGSMVHVMFVDWASLAPIGNSSERVAEKIENFLKQSDLRWDISLIGHSRGAILNTEVASYLSGSIAKKVQLVMLDPTAGVSLNDQYPARVPDSVDNAVHYDDGMKLFPGGATREGFKIEGAQYHRVDAPAAGRVFSSSSHSTLAEFYSKAPDPREGGKGNPELTFHRESDWLLGKKAGENFNEYGYENQASWEVARTSAPANDWLSIFDVGFEENINGDAVGYFSMLGVGGGSFSVGKSGVTVNFGISLMGNQGASITKKGFSMTVSGPGYSFADHVGQIIVSHDETSVDLDIGPLRVSMFGKDAGVYWGGERVSMHGFVSPNNSNVSYERIARFFKQSFAASDVDIVQQMEQLGAMPAETAAALRDGLGHSHSQIAQALRDGLGAGHRIVADALYNGTTKNLRVIASTLKSSGYGIGQVADALTDQLNASPRQTADALYHGFTKNLRKVARAMRQEGASVGQITDALDDKLKVSPRATADALYHGVTKNLVKIARAMKKEGASLRQIADAFDDKLKVSYRATGHALYHGVTKNLVRIADVLHNESATLAEIADVFDDKLKVGPRNTAHALYKGVTKNLVKIAKALDAEGKSLKQIADALDDKLKVSYRSTAYALYHGVTKNLTRIADVMDKEGASLKEIADAFDDRLHVSYKRIAYALKKGVTGNARKIAKVLRQEGASAKQVASSLKHAGVSSKKIDDALKHGAKFSGKAIGNALRSSGISIGGARRSIRKLF